MLCKVMSATGALMLAATVAQSATITFDPNGTLPVFVPGGGYGTNDSAHEVGDDTDNVYTSDGYSFTSYEAPIHVGFVSDSGSYSGLPNGNVVFLDDPILFTDALDVARTDGEKFSFFGVDVGNLGGANAITVSIFAATSLGGYEFAETVLEPSAELISWVPDSPWVDIVGLYIVVTDPGAAGTTGVAIDNLMVSDVAAVPLPASILMLGAAFGGVSLVRRRRSG